MRGDAVPPDGGARLEDFFPPAQRTAFVGIVERLTAPGALVVDPFVGTGTTGVACVQTGRRFIGGDVDAEQVAVARARIAKALAERDCGDAAPQPEPADEGARDDV